MSAVTSIIRELPVAASVLHPIRLQILKQLSSPKSATEVSKSLNFPRQKIAYHFKELEKHNLVELVETRRKGNCSERILKATAESYVISPETLGAVSVSPDKIKDQFSWSYLVAICGRAVRDLGILRARANKAKKKLATFSLQTEVKFDSPQAQSEFAEELTQSVSALITKYHKESASEGRIFNLVLGSYPKITREE